MVAVVVVDNVLECVGCPLHTPLLLFVSINRFRCLSDPPMDQCKSELFEMFKEDHPLTGQILNHKNHLRQQYLEAKRLGKLLKKYKETIGKTGLCSSDY